MSTNEVAEVKAEKTLRPFGIKDKLAYAAGDFGCNLSFALKNTLFLFYTQYIGLSIATWSVIILVMQIWDAVNDPLIGGLIDRTKPGKHGKYKPWMFWGAALLTISGAMLFIPIPTAPTWIKIVVACLGYAVWDMSYTMVNVPYGALNAVITGEATERASLSVWRGVGALVPQLLIMVILPYFIYADPDNSSTLLGENVFYAALICGVLAFGVFMFMIRTTVERVEPIVQEQQKFNYFKAIKSYLRNGPLLAMTGVAMLMLIVMSGTTTATAVLYQTYFNDSQNSGLVSLLAYIPMIAVMPFITPLAKKFGNKNIASWPLLISIVGALLMIFVPLGTGFTNMLIWGVFNMIAMLGMSVVMTLCYAMVSDSIDYNEYKTGERDEGTSYALYSFGRKLAQGLGASGIGLLLLAVGYSERGLWDYTIMDFNPAIQTIEVATNIKTLVGILYLVVAVGMFVLVRFCYSLNNKKLAVIRAELAERREAAGIVVEETDVSKYMD